MNTIPDLKPCPFCGSPGELFRGQQMRDGHMTHYVLARCTNCKAGTRRTDYPAAEPVSEPEDRKAANLWNRRQENVIIHDCSTTIACDRCSEEFTVTKKVGVVNMRRLAKGFGWKDTGEQDLCPRCAEKFNKEVPNG